MLKICFVCHGNICRSPMAEYIMKDIVKKMSLENEFLVISRATSYEEIGNDIHYGTKFILDKYNIKYDKHSAKRLQNDDYNKYDYFVCMDDNNIRNTLKIFKDVDKKIRKLNCEDIEDPWYTGNFEKVYLEINEGVSRLIKDLI